MMVLIFKLIYQYSVCVYVCVFICMCAAKNNFVELVLSNFIWVEQGMYMDH